MKKWLPSILLLMVLAVPASLLGQGCALCYTQAAGSGPKMIAALKSGILVLVFPPMGICAMLTWMGYRKRNRFNSCESSQPDDARPNADLGW